MSQQGFDPAKPQPAPQESEHADVLSEVLKALPEWTGDTPETDVMNIAPYLRGLVTRDLCERAEVGEVKYGTKLKPFNCREPLVDAYQEALDLMMYLQQSILESPDPGVELLFGQACVMALALRSRISFKHPTPRPHEYSYSTNQEEYRGGFSDREEALCAAQEDAYGDACDDDGMATVWTGRCMRPEESILDRCKGLADNAIDTLEERLYDDWGGDGHAIQIRPENLAILDKLIASYLLEHASFDRFGITDIQEHQVHVGTDDGDGVTSWVGP